MKSTLERRPGRVIFTRPGQTPGLHERIYHLALLATGACSTLMLWIEPFFAAMGATVAGVVVMAMGLVVTSTNMASGGRLLQVRKRFELVTPMGDEGYRDAPSEEALEVEGRRFPKSKVREVVLGHFFTSSGGGAQHDFWPVYLVLDELVIELAVLRDKAAALTLHREIGELFDVPTRERETMTFGTGVAAGCLNGAAMVGFDLLFLMAPVFVLITLGKHAAVPIPAVLALLLWLNHRFTPRIFGAEIRRAIDDQVAERFELGARARVSTQAEADAIEVEAQAEVVGEAEAEVEA